MSVFDFHANEVDRLLLYNVALRASVTRELPTPPAERPWRDSMLDRERRRFDSAATPRADELRPLPGASTACARAAHPIGLRDFRGGGPDVHGGTGTSKQSHREN